MNITPERWAQLEPHFDALLDLDAAAKTAYLERLAKSDRDLAEELFYLLKEEASGKTLADLQGQTPDLLAALGEEKRAAISAATDVAGKVLGPYRIISTLGSGGMSIVYLAERTDGKFDQQVAVKVLHWSAGKDSVLRFQREQQTLAKLDHPSITRIYDAGIIEDGLPYYVMELVDGAPITEYCKNNNLSVRRRIRLFLSICDGVHSSHQNLIVHRDLKPANVLVTRDGHVKILDFGIAKWLADEEGAQAPLLTRQGEGLLTPQYASPEQFLGNPITTASDIYSLGLLLYEILAGTPPYELARKPPTEQQRLVCETVPTPPSAKASDPKIKGEIRGDLETITLKALQKEPTRRYGSANALADDLRRYLDGLPIEAAPDSFVYRTQKFVQRNKVGVAVSSLAFLSLIGGIIGVSWQAQQASLERDRARVEAAHATAVADFLITSLEQANPYESGSIEDITVRELFETTVDRVDTELAEQPELQYRLYSTFANVYGQTGEKTRGLEMADRAVRLADSLYTKESVEASDARYRKGLILAHIDPIATEELFLDVERTLRSLGTKEARLQLAYILEAHGGTLSQRAANDSALAMQREALGIREEEYDGFHLDLARSHLALASILSNRGSSEASYHFQRAAEIWREVNGPLHPNYATTLNNWAIFMGRQGKCDSALVLYEDALAVRRKSLGERAYIVGSQLSNMSTVAIVRGRFEQAEGWLREGIAIMLEHEEGSALDKGAAYANLGQALVYQGRYQEAIDAYTTSRSLFVGTFGERHPYPAVIDSYFGLLYLFQNRDAEAVRHLEAASKVFLPVQPALANRLVAVETWHGRILDRQGSDRAEPLLRQAVERAYEHVKDGDEYRAQAEAALGICLIGHGNREEGISYLRLGYEALLAKHGESHLITRWARDALIEAGEPAPGTMAG